MKMSITTVLCTNSIKVIGGKPRFHVKSKANKEDEVEALLKAGQGPAQFYECFRQMMGEDF